MAESPAALYAQARQVGALIDLSDRAKWQLTGADRIRYLNGQVTNDIRRATATAALPACVTTAKGRLSGMIFVSAPAGFLRIDADAVLRDSLSARLERYIIADDALLHDTTDEESLFHTVGGPPPHAIEGAEARTATRFGRAGFDILAPRGEHARVQAALAGTHILIPRDLAETFRIESGSPLWGAELTEETLPPEAGLDRVAIDYHKGCYIGQEVISRIKSVGHVNRHLAGFTAATALAPGMTLRPADDPGKAAGEITSGAWSFGLDCWAALGYLRRGFANTALLAGPAEGPLIAVQTRELPLVP